MDKTLRSSLSRTMSAANGLIEEHIGQLFCEQNTFVKVKFNSNSTLSKYYASEMFTIKCSNNDIKSRM